MDYKLLTKVLTNCLTTMAMDLIYKSQAGFIPRRHITDQTKLIILMMEYTKVSSQNGLIVTLDQEKAYNKIDHTCYGIP